jgi:hypothetical protein
MAVYKSTIIAVHEGAIKQSAIDHTDASIEDHDQSTSFPNEVTTNQAGPSFPNLTTANHEDHARTVEASGYYGKRPGQLAREDLATLQERKVQHSTMQERKSVLDVYYYHTHQGS